MSERELASLEMPVRASNVFKNSDIKTVADLATWSPGALLNQQNFGRKSLRDTLEALNAALNEGPVRGASIDKTPDSDRLLTEMRRSLLSFPERERDILMRRLGFETSPETLQEVADDYGITRERIRQIEARATEKWIRESYWDDILEHKIARLLIGRNYPLPVAGVEAIDPWFEGVSLGAYPVDSGSSICSVSGRRPRVVARTDSRWPGRARFPNSRKHFLTKRAA